MAMVKDFLEWMDAIDEGISNLVQIAEDGYDEETNARMVRVNLFTSTHRYGITAINARGNSSSYLGCIAYCRAPYAGEEHIRSSDLADGKLTEETWQEIKDDILRHELVNMGSAQFNPMRA